MISERLRRALSSVPKTKPSWTAMVSQLAAESLRCHSTRKAGTTADALNQSDMPSNSARDKSASARHLRGSAGGRLSLGERLAAVMNGGEDTTLYAGAGGATEGGQGRARGAP